MARFALILPSGVVERVIIADQAFIDSNPIIGRGAVAPERLADRYARAVEVVYPGETATGPGALATRECEPGATIDRDGKVARTPREAAPKTIDERIADIEAAIAAKVVR